MADDGSIPTSCLTNECPADAPTLSEHLPGHLDPAYSHEAFDTLEAYLCDAKLFEPEVPVDGLLQEGRNNHVEVAGAAAGDGSVRSDAEMGKDEESREVGSQRTNSGDTGEQDISQAAEKTKGHEKLTINDSGVSEYGRDQQNLEGEEGAGGNGLREAKALGYCSETDDTGDYNGSCDHVPFGAGNSTEEIDNMGETGRSDEEDEYDETNTVYGDPPSEKEAQNGRETEEIHTDSGDGGWECRRPHRVEVDTGNDEFAQIETYEWTELNEVYHHIQSRRFERPNRKDSSGKPSEKKITKVTRRDQDFYQRWKHVSLTFEGVEGVVVLRYEGRKKRWWGEVGSYEMETNEAGVRAAMVGDETPVRVYRR